MIASPRAHLLIGLALVAAAASGCSTSAPSRFYTLDAAAAPAGAAPVGETIMVGPVSVPASVDRPEFVVRTAANQVEVDEFNRWDAPLGDSIARAVAGNLVRLLGTPNVAAGPLANFNPAYRVTIEVQRFESVPGQSATIEAEWTVYRTAGGETRSGHTTASEAVQGEGFDTLAAAHSRALAKLSDDIAAAIRTEAQEKAALKTDGLSDGRIRTSNRVARAQLKIDALAHEPVSTLRPRRSPGPTEQGPCLFAGAK